MQRRLARRALHTNTTSRRRRRRRKERARDPCLSGFYFFCSWSETWQLWNRCGTPKISNVFFSQKTQIVSRDSKTINWICAEIGTVSFPFLVPNVEILALGFTHSPFSLSVLHSCPVTFTFIYSFIQQWRTSQVGSDPRAFPKTPTFQFGNFNSSPHNGTEA